MEANALIRGDKVIIDGTEREVRDTIPCIATRQTCIIFRDGTDVTLANWYVLPVTHTAIV